MNQAKKGIAERKGMGNDNGNMEFQGLRGSTLEDMINRTNEKYEEAGLALIQENTHPHHPH